MTPAPDADVTAHPVLLEMRGIVKRFGDVVANDGVDLDVRAGQVVGLLGENGSGKSTLMKLLFGITRPDGGRITFKGRPLSAHRPADAIAAGIAMIHQHFTLVEALSVLENVMLGWREAGRILRRRKIAALVRQTSARFGLDLDPETRISDLSLGRRQRVEILKAILRGADLLILDEPTSNLAQAEVHSLLGVLRSLRDAGAGIVFITHKLPEALAVCDEVVVLRAGRRVAAMPARDASRESLARAMVGTTIRAPAAPTPPRDAPRDHPVRLAASGLVGPALAGIDLELRAGEVLGVVGVDGNGQLELVETLAGSRAAAGGRIMLEGRDITRDSVAARIRAGIAYCPADRAQVSLAPRMSIAENLTLRQDGRRAWSRGWAARAAAARRLMAHFDIRAAGPGTVVATLSGGNQQKIVLARELDRRPSVLIAHQPAWGLDPAATAFVLDQIRALCHEGAAILYVSSELEEVLSVSDRVAVLSGGRFAGLTRRDAVDATQLGLWMSGAAA